MGAKPAAIVTGASRGIGKAIALELALQGYDLVISHFDFTAEGKPDESRGLEAQKEIADLGGGCHALRADVSRREDRIKLVESAKDSFGRCDMLVNNAGIAPTKRVDLLEATEESFDRVIGVNLKGAYFLSQLVAKWMIEQSQEHNDRSMRIVNIGSISSYTSSPGRGEYCVSKAGVSMMTRLYADRLAKEGIGVFEIRPGIIATDMTAAVKGKYDELIGKGLTPIRRWGEPVDVAKAVGAIAEGRLDFSTGQIINVDGGFHFRRL